jgi:YidC/Oxa1 family membrane protein insertase
MDSPQEYLWVGIENRYFTVIFLNVDRFGAAASKKGKRGPYKLSLNKEIEISSGETVSFELPFYAGPKHYDTLKKFGHELDATIQFGIFSPVSKFFLSCLKLFYGLTHNYGVAIIFLTILIQCFTFPLTLKSFESSKSMKLIQPKMKELQTKYKSDPKRLNTEIMHLYKSHKVNPLGGCLPMILQLPIFWSLFTTLRSTYELRRAPFILWITDLSSPDLLFSIGSIPVRVLPLLMGLSMFLQQKISGTGTDPSQRTMMYLMPAVFTVIFMNFPSGLVLYWLVNNILVTTLQYYMLKRIPSNKFKAAT